MYDVTIQNGNEVITIHDHHSASTSRKLASGSIVDAENSISSFTFTIYPNNEGYDNLNAYTTLIKVRNTKRSKDEFVGRLLQVSPEMDSNGMVSKTVVCEDRLGYLHDSVQPYAEMRHFVGDVSRTGLEEFIDVLLENHNAQVEPYKRIYRGTVTVKPFESSNDVTKGLNWQSTFDAIKEKLLNSFGGFIRLRESAGTLYLDYLESVGATRSTTIELGRNMRSASKEIDPSGIVTRVIPLGAKLVKDDGNGNEVESEERLTIAAINNGLDYIESVGYAQQFGIKYGTVIFDDVTDTNNLLRKGTEWLTANNGLVVSHKVDALDLSLIGLDIDDFVLHDSYPVKNTLIGMNDILKIIKKTTNIIEPQNSSFEMGAITKRLSDLIIDEMQNIANTNGINGLNGKNSYLHIMYSANADGSGMTERPDNTTAYMGTCSCASPEPPTDPAAYRWSLIRGTVSYTWVKYADTPTSGMSDNPDGKKYIGFAYNKTTATESERYEDYSWTLIQGKTGVGVERIVPRYAVGTSEIEAPSEPSVAGWPIFAPELSYGEYLWCAYYIQYTDGTDAWTEPFNVRSADQITQANSAPENPAAGTLWLDTTTAPYVLRRFNGTSWEAVSDYSSEFEEVYDVISETTVDVGKLEEGIMAKVEETTTAKSVYEEFSTIVKNILNMEADNTTMIFQTINDAIKEVGDTEQTHHSELLTYIRFNENGIHIGKEGNAITMQLDNDSLDFYNNGTKVAYISDNQLYISDGRFLRSVRIGNYGFIPEANGSVSFTYLGGDS